MSLTESIDSDVKTIIGHVGQVAIFDASALPECMKSLTSLFYSKESQEKNFEILERHRYERTI